ncbi:HAD-IA family hydrolase [Variovorax sp. OV329]|uniref:HAD-IA family hydrolase n=1 Tax=Variovorax sp. OV329 TaxID=1882825 RepID=UPI0008E1FBAE|nr:HAD-IA family hydrolase [Variovorax sp. OV329]SFL95651.1 haloacid dehalogenase superfamily, subfamily IA, variant 3 with third motif having DD or ED [Variovorax sp. OV329]
MARSARRLPTAQGTSLAALLWDVDGTLAETERDGHRVAFNRAFAQMGLPWHWSPTHYGRLLRVTGGRERLLAAMAEEADPPELPAEREALARELHRLKNLCYAECVRGGVIELRPGVAALIDEASARGLRQAIVTTTSRANVQVLLGHCIGAEWAARFDVVVCAEDVSAKKPDPQAHRRALDALRCPSACTLAIEDSRAGASAAHAAGVPVLVTRSAYFPDDPIDAAVAIGPGLHTREGWQPPAAPGRARRITLDDLIDWHERLRPVTGRA